MLLIPHLIVMMNAMLGRISSQVSRALHSNISNELNMLC